MRQWWRVLHISRGKTAPDLGPTDVARAVIRRCYVEAIKLASANGADEAAMSVIDAACDEALRSLED